MCWNASVSLNTYLFSLFASVFALMNGVLNLELFAFMQTYITIQLLEYLVWSKSFSNRLLSQIMFVVILLQPFASVLAIQSQPAYRLPLAIAYALFAFAVVVIVKPWNTIDFRSVKGPNGHLAWHWLDFSLPVILVWVAFFLVRYVIDKEYVAAILSAGIVALFYVLYHKTHTWGSMWCWIANAVAVMLIAQVFMKEVCSIR